MVQGAKRAAAAIAAAFAIAPLSGCDALSPVHRRPGFRSTRGGRVDADVGPGEEPVGRNPTAEPARSGGKRPSDEGPTNRRSSPPSFGTRSPSSSGPANRDRDATTETTVLSSAFLFSLLASVLCAPVTLDFGARSLGPPAGAVVGLSVPRVAVERSVARAAALTENQRTVSDVWWAVTSQFFDPTYNGLGESGWRAKKLEAIESVSDAGPDDQDVVTAAIDGMLSALGDPYTRFLPPEKFEAINTYARGSSSSGGGGGIGVQLLLDPRSGSVVVMNAAKDGPAAKGGIRPMDVVLKVDGTDVERGSTAEMVAAMCRGEPGAAVELVVRHAPEDGSAASKGKTEKVSVRRAKIKVNPVETSTFASEGGRNLGLLRVRAFSQETPAQIVEGMRDLKNNRATGEEALEAIVVDLRGNVGGYLPAGIDAARLFLPRGAAVVAEMDRAGSGKYYFGDGIGSDTATPLYLLVDGRTASAAEIFAAALKDNRRATVVGTKTFGKGRIQNVQPLENGSGVAVTRARYVTPAGRDIHGVGIPPNKESNSCGPEKSAAACLSGII